MMGHRWRGPTVAIKRVLALERVSVDGRERGSADERERGHVIVFFHVLYAVAGLYFSGLVLSTS